MSMSGEKILAVKDGRIGRFTINRPEKRNAMSLDMWRRMGEIFEAWADDPDVRVILVRGSGDKCFCAGNDISEFKDLRSSPNGIAAYHATTERAYAALRGIAKPTIARIEGFCMGGGLELAQLCDIQIAADTATFAVTLAKLGIGYKLDDVRLLTDAVSAKHAKEILFTGRKFPAADALRWGLVNRVVTAADLDATIDGYMEEIAANAPLSVKAAKLIVNEAVKGAANCDEALCASLVDACNESDDYIEGQRAFTEKRKPDFKGR
ncbi:MAG TPA: enoyl-CoA hydratase [Rhodospirillales bacterium]|jgi:enoyl-CoA hydratase/carnithine racemase|nr:enoyl-CoA hydratase [Rhodospirillales bacterium]